MDDFFNPTNEPQPPSEAPLQPEVQSESQFPPIAQTRPEQARPSPWGVWATLGWAILVGIVFSIAQAAVVAVFTVMAYLDNPKLDSVQLIKSFESNGFLLSVAVCASSLASGLVTILAARQRWPGTARASMSPEAATPEAASTNTPPVSWLYTWRHYLALRPVSLKTLLPWLGALCLFAVASDLLTYSLGRPIVPDFMQKAYGTARFLPLLWMAVVIFGPVFEELFFRGFLFRGLAESKLGAVGTILITSLLWASIHLQYDAYGIFLVFVAGLLLGWTRVRTDSIYPPIAMHCLMNFIATTEAALQHSGLLNIP